MPFRVLLFFLTLIGVHSLVTASQCGTQQQVFGFGRNVDGQLGDGTAVSSNVAVPMNTSGVFAGKSVVAICASDRHSLVLSDDHKLFSFGWNSWGQLGDGTSTTQNSPVPVQTNENITDIICAYEYSLIISENGQIFAFGRNNFGQLGDGSQTNRKLPVAVNTSGVLNGKRIVAATGGHHSLVLSEDGGLYSWGLNHDGQLGDGTFSSTLNPVEVNTAASVHCFRCRTGICLWK